MEKYCVRGTYLIKEVIEQFERENDRVAIVLSETNKVIGVVSQGDLLRAIATGISIYTPISQIISNSFLHSYENDMDKIYSIFKSKKITLLPIINYENELTDVITLTEIYNYCDNRS